MFTIIVHNHSATNKRRDIADIKGKNMNILLVEDDEAIVRNLSALLREEGYDVDCACRIRDAQDLLADHMYHLVLLDISLPDGSGFDLYKTPKLQSLPVIFLTASDDEDSIVKGFEYGAHDYISKPFRVRELLSRIKNVLRRYQTENIIQVQKLQIDTEKGILLKNKCEVPLSALEYRLLMTFVNHRGMLLTRNQLLEDIWDIAGDFVNDNTLTVYIKRLREKIEDDPQSPSIIKTVRGIGYRMD